MDPIIKDPRASSARQHALPPTPKAIFFDFDGTLINSIAFLTKAHNAARSKLGFPLFQSIKEFEPYFGMPRDKMYASMYAGKADQARAFFDLYIKENHLNDLKAMPDAEDLLRTIKEQNILCGLVSNKKHEFLIAECHALGWDKYFKVILGSGQAKQDKPAPDLLQLAIKRTEIEATPPEHIWYIGDTDNDALCALRTGVTSIMVEPFTMSDFSKKYENNEIKTENLNYNSLFFLDNCNKITQTLKNLL